MRKIDYTGVVRIIVNTALAVFVLYDVINKIKHLNLSTYEFLWKSQLVFILICDVFFISRNILNKPKEVDTSILAVSAGCLAAILPYCMELFTEWPPVTLMFKTPGIVLNVLVCPFVLWALFCLKDCLSIIPEANKVVSKGIYKYSRHPLYVCYSLWCVSYVMMNPTLPVLFIVIAIVNLQYVRSRLEEEILLRNIPSYESYYKETSLISLPFVKLG